MQNLSKKIDSVDGDIQIESVIKSGPVSEICFGFFNNKKCVIRIDLHLAKKLNLNRSNEMEVITEINYLDIAPNILYKNSLNGIFIWNYIEGNEVHFLQNNNHNLLNELGKKIKILHQHPLNKNTSADFKSSIDFYKDQLKDLDNQTIIDKGFLLFDELSSDGLDHVLSHNDLNYKNILYNLDYKFLDWEYSCINHPYFDLASVIQTFKLQEGQIEVFLNGYGINQSKANLKTLDRWVEFTYYLDYFWQKTIILLSDMNHPDINTNELEKYLSNI